MILDQNTIVLNPCNGFYDEYRLVSGAQADKVNTDGTGQIETPIRILPGAVVGQATIDPIFDAKKYPFYITTPGMPEAKAKLKFYDDLEIAKKQAGSDASTYTQKFDGKTVHIGSYVDPEDNKTKKGDYELDGGEALEAFYAKFPKLHVVTAGLIDNTLTGNALTNALDSVEILILVENALLGKGICALYFPGEVTPVYSPVSGDRYLGRCVPGEYTEGDPLYLCNYEYDIDGKGTKVKGFYFCGADAVDDDGAAIVHSKEIKAFAGEDFICPKESNANRKPYPFFRDVIDDSTTERPATTNINGALTNLLRVRMA